MKRALLMIVASVGTASAEPLVDVALLFNQHADKIVVKDSDGLVSRQVALGDGVVVRCKGKEGFDDCTSIDTNDRGGTTDCALVSAARTLLIAQDCKVGGAGQRFMLDKVINQLGEHVARNAVPPRDWTALRAVVMRRTQDYPLPTCKVLDRQARDYLAHRMRLKELLELQDMTKAPRLPVGKCLD
jgi:hypothetical protein